jgi:hypothetical protein
MPIFYNSEALIVRIAWNTSDYGDRLAGFQMVLVINEAKRKVCNTMNI